MPIRKKQDNMELLNDMCDHFLAIHRSFQLIDKGKSPNRIINHYRNKKYKSVFNNNPRVKNIEPTAIDKKYLKFFL